MPAEFFWGILLSRKIRVFGCSLFLEKRLGPFKVCLNMLGEGIIRREKQMIKQRKIKRWILLLLLAFVLLVMYCYSQVNFSQRYTIIMENHTESTIERISFSTRADEVSSMEVTEIAPGESIKITRDFDVVSDKFIAKIDTPWEQDKVIPLAYIYSPNSKNIVKLIIEEAEGNQISKLTLKSFDNFPTVIPWWFRAFYDYTIVDYPMKTT